MKGADIMRDLEDIMCIAHTDKYAVYADQYERLKVIRKKDFYWFMVTYIHHFQQVL